MTSLNERLQALEERVKHRESVRRPEPEEVKKLVQLPLWPEPTRGLPNSTLRGALFSATQGKNRQALKRQLIMSQQGIEIRFTGWQLDQSDLDVWEQCLHLARIHPLGTQCDFTAYGFLKALGRQTGKSQHEQLKDHFARLAGGVAEITHNHKTYFGPMIEGGIRDESTQRYVINLNPQIIKLYGPGMWTVIDWQQRHQLSRKPLALWLHGFYSTHAKPFPMKVETLRDLSGSKTKQVWKFKQNLKIALDDLQEVGAIEDYEIIGDLVTVYRTPSDSQRRHLIKPKPRKR